MFVTQLWLGLAAKKLSVPVLVLITDGDSGEGQGRDIFVPDVDATRIGHEFDYITPQHVAEQPKGSHNDQKPQNSVHDSACNLTLTTYAMFNNLKEFLNNKQCVCIESSVSRDAHLRIINLLPLRRYRTP